MPASDRISAALEQLDPPDRELIELSELRGVSDAEIANLMDISPGDLEHTRHEALDELAAELGMATNEIPDLRAQLAEMREDNRSAIAAEPEPAAAAGTQPESAPGPAQAQRPKVTRAAATPATAGTTRLGQLRTRPLPAALAVLVIAVVVVLIVVLARGGDDEPATTKRAPAGEVSTTSGSKTAPQPRTPEAGQPMQRLNGTYGHGTAELRQEGGKAVLRLSASGFLRPVGGGYAVWLYNSRTDARRLYATTSTTIERDIPLPDDYKRYRYVEVARAIPDLDSDHSAITLLRVEIAALQKQ